MIQWPNSSCQYRRLGMSGTKTASQQWTVTSISYWQMAVVGSSMKHGNKRFSVFKRFNLKWLSLFFFLRIYIFLTVKQIDGNISSWHKFGMPTLYSNFFANTHPVCLNQFIASLPALRRRRFFPDMLILIRSYKFFSQSAVYIIQNLTKSTT